MNDPIPIVFATWRANDRGRGPALYHTFLSLRGKTHEGTAASGLVSLQAE